MQMHELAREAMQSMPEQVRFSVADSAVLGRYSAALLPLEDQFVTGFYDMLFAHGPTAQVFVEGERPMREQTLRDWWQRTVSGPLDEEYFAWMAMVGLVHVVRGVQNPMMLAMTQYAQEFVAAAVHALELPPAQAKEVLASFARFTTSVGAVITYGYDQSVAEALFNIAGMRQSLLSRLRNQEVQAALDQARTELAR